MAFNFKIKNEGTGVPTEIDIGDSKSEQRTPEYRKTVQDIEKRYQDNVMTTRSDRELELFPTLQKFDSLVEDVNLLIEKLGHIENDIKELRKEILEI